MGMGGALWPMAALTLQSFADTFVKLRTLHAEGSYRAITNTLEAQRYNQRRRERGKPVEDDDETARRMGASEASMLTFEQRLSVEWSRPNLWASFISGQVRPRAPSGLHLSDVRLTRGGRHGREDARS